MNAPIRLKDPSVSGKQYTISMGFGGFASLVAGLALALSLFFVLGVLVGRGHKPETAVPVVAGIMPKEAVPTVPPPPQEVLKPEELSYSEHLGQQHDGPAPARAIDAGSPKPQARPAAKPAAKSAAKPAATPEPKPAPVAAAKAGTAAPGKAATAPVDGKVDRLAAAAVAKAQGKKAGPEAKPDPDSRRYDYAYQTATFPDADSARSHLKRIKALGLKGDVETGQTDGRNWHRVVVFFQGTPTDTRALKAKLASIGVQKLVMRSKVAAE